jgi:2-polyprenyl-3-methyl-5-hydroxy-6-metoxy-1,4-benzoquinol methylase
MWEGFAEDYFAHARDSAYNAYYDRPSVLEALGPVRGLRLLDAGCGPGLYLGEPVARGDETRGFGRDHASGDSSQVPHSAGSTARGGLLTESTR